MSSMNLKVFPLKLSHLKRLSQVKKSIEQHTTTSAHYPSWPKQLSTVSNVTSEGLLEGIRVYQHPAFECIISPKLQTSIRNNLNKSRCQSRIQSLNATSSEYINKCSSHIGINLLVSIPHKSHKPT